MPARSSVYSINNTEMQKVLSFAARTCFFSWFINRFLENNRGDRHLFEAVSWYWFPYNLISSAHFAVVVVTITVSGTDSDSHLGATRSLCFLPGNGCWNETVNFSYCLSALTVYKPTFQTSLGWSEASCNQKEKQFTGCSWDPYLASAYTHTHTHTRTHTHTHFMLETPGKGNRFREKGIRYWRELYFPLHRVGLFASFSMHLSIDRCIYTHFLFFNRRQNQASL